MYEVSSDSEFLGSNKDKNLNNADFCNLHSPRNFCNICLFIQVLLVNKWYTLKAGVWDNIIESRQWILIYV